MSTNQEIGSFADLANIKGTDVTPPKPVPVGHYIAQVTGLGKEVKAGSGNIGIEFPCKAIAPHDDVDPELYAASDGVGEGKKFALTFWMSPDARYRFTDFTSAIGINQEQSIVEIAQDFGASNSQFLIEHRLEQDQGNPAKGKAPATNPDGTPKMWSRWDNPTALPA